MNEKEETYILITEYQSLYSLYRLRLNALEKKLLIAVLLIKALLGRLAALTKDIKKLYLFGILIALIYLVKRITIHLQLSEYLYRRIEEVEQWFNDLASRQLLTFQIEHPNKRTTLGGNFRKAAANSVFILTFWFLGSCSYVSHSLGHNLYLNTCYYIPIILDISYLFFDILHFKKYIYSHSISVSSDLQGGGEMTTELSAKPERYFAGTI